MMRLRRILAAAAAACLAVPLLCVLSACDSLVDDRIPAFPVTIRLSDTGTWNTYGVAGFGVYRYFNRQTREPANFPFTEQTFTGFGGVLLIGGMNPFEGNTQAPLAYDLACPVECRQDIRVKIDPATYDAVCPVCGSHYDVTMAMGAPKSGPAADGKHKYGLQKYSCIPSPFGGYDIVR